MINRKEADLVRSQKSISYFGTNIQDDPVLGRHSGNYLAGNAYMLIDDVRTSILPYSSHSAKRRLEIELVPADKSIEILISHALGRNHYGRDFSYDISEFFHDCAADLLIFAKSTYEIVYLSRPNNGVVMGFDLHHILPAALSRRLGKLVQYVPPALAQQRNISQFVELDPETILIFRPPASIGSNLQSMSKSLADISRQSFPEFLMRQMSEGNIRTPYDSKVHIRSEKLALAHVTRDIGWNARWSFADVTLDYYFVYRQLRFELFLIKLREEILKTLNDGIRRVGQKMGFSAQIGIEGLPTRADVEEARNHLAAGDQTFKDILAPFNLF